MQLVTNQKLQGETKTMCKCKYDENENVMHVKDSIGFEYWYEYDENGNMIHGKNSDGSEIWYVNYEDGNEKQFKNNPKGYEIISDILNLKEKVLDGLLQKGTRISLNLTNGYLFMHEICVLENFLV